jgi:hypothetical protein
MRKTYQINLVGFLFNQKYKLKFMYMKKLIYSLALIFTLGISANTVSANDRSDKKKPEMTAEQKVQFERIVNRVEQIRDMDKSQLSSSERSELRKELRELKAQARATSGGVYLSVGAIIIIILLLILIL